jgi:hypothetical protein
MAQGLIQSTAKKEGEVYGSGSIYKRPNSRFYWMQYYVRGEQKNESTRKLIQLGRVGS